MGLKNSLVALVVLAISGSAFAFQVNEGNGLENLTARSWTIEDGLPVNNMLHVVQDKKGYIWITSYDGLVRFDGLRFKVFNHANTTEMPHNRTTEIHVQENVGIWVALEHGGVLLIKDDKFTHFGEEDGFTDAVIFTIYQDSANRVFFLTHEGLFVYADQKFSKFFSSENKPRELISSIFQDYDQSLWLATNNGLVHIAHNEIREYQINSAQKKNIIKIVHRTRKGKLIAGTANGVFELAGNELISVDKYKLLDNESIERIYEDENNLLFSTPTGVYGLVENTLQKMPFSELKQGELYTVFYKDKNENLWVIGNLGSYNILSNGELVKLQGLEIPEDLWINFINEDKEGNIWLSTKTGLLALRESKVKTIGVKEGLSGNNILGLLTDSKGRQWVCTRGGGLNLIENNQIYHFLYNDGIASQIVHTIAEDKEGNIWVGYHQKGIDQISNSGIKNYPLGDNVDLNTVNALFVAKDSTIWAGTNAGLVAFDPVGLNHRLYNEDDGLNGKGIRYITQDSAEGLWIGSMDGGVSYYKEGSFTNYTMTEGLSSNNIRSIYVDEFEQGTIWIGTENNGLNRLKNGKIDFITTTDGLPDYNLHWISQDSAQWLWMSSNKGVFRINKADLNGYLDGLDQSFRLIHYGKEEGMRNPEGNGSVQEAGMRTDEGAFWFATQEGVAIFNEKSSSGNEVYPTVLIDAVTAQGRSFSTDTVIFDPGISDFQISFHAITFLSPEKTRFRYKFLDKEDAWTDLHNKRNVHFSNLAPGNYELIVQATNSEGEWSPEHASVLITLKRKYYQRVGFYVLLLLILVASFFIISRFRYQWLINKQKKLQQIIDEQTHQLTQEKNEIQNQKLVIEKQARNLETINETLAQTNKTKDKFFSIIAHDLRNPFQAMLGYSEFVHDNFEDFSKETVQENIGVIRDSAKTLFDLTQNLLSWAIIQTGKVKPEKEKFLLCELVEKNLKLYFQSAQQKKIELNFKCPESLELFADRNMIDTILRNLLSNAIKFTNSGGRVSLFVKLITGRCEITIKDNGIGMNQELLADVMSLGSQSTRRGTAKESGSGLGLVLCREMIEMHDGDLKIESKEGIGTTFTVILPLSD